MESPLQTGALSPERAAALLDRSDEKIGHLYLHLPFCGRICPYCDFSTVAGADADIGAFVNALKKEADLHENAGILPHLMLDGGTLFLGGGTPSWFEPRILAHLLSWLESLTGGRWAEATLEMNPEHAERERLEALRSGGISRLSLGVQSLDPAVLKRLGRIHSPMTAREAAGAARKSGFDVSIDIIFAVPGQDQQGWQSDVRGVVELEPDHISIYELTYEPGTPFARWLGSGRLVALDEDWQAEAYSWAVEYLDSEGYRRYEVSNFARPGKVSLHNQACWDGSAYLGLGPSAHSLLDTIRTANISDFRDWTSALMNESRVPWESSEELDDCAITRERVLLGLRTDRGLNLEILPSQFRKAVSERASEIVREGFAQWNEENALVLSSRGILVADMLALRLSP